MRRRGFLASILAAGVAPAAIGSNILMPVRRLALGDTGVDWFFRLAWDMPELKDAMRIRLTREMLLAAEPMLALESFGTQVPEARTIVFRRGFSASTLAALTRAQEALK